MAKNYFITGGKEFESLLKDIARKQVSKIAKKTTKEVCNYHILSEAKSNAVRMVGGDMGSKISSSLATRVMTRLRKGSYGHRVIIKPTDFFVYETVDSTYSVSTKKRLSGKRYYIPFAIEYGHAFPGRGGKNAPKDVAPKPFMRSAYESKRVAAATLAAEKLQAQISDYIKQNRVNG